MANLGGKQLQAYQAIRRKILEGRVRTRKDLSHHTLSDEIGVGTTCVQMALGRLAAEGLLECRPQSGTFLRQLDMAELQHIFEIRILLEPYAAARAARFITPRQLKKLEDSCDDLETLYRKQAVVLKTPPDHREKILCAEHAFHGAIVAATRNPVIVHLVENQHILSFGLSWVPLQEDRQEMPLSELTLAEHRGIAEAIRDRNSPLARKRMLHHLRTAIRRLKRVIRNREEIDP